MRSYFFSADTQEDMLGWVRALSQSACMEADSSINRYLYRALLDTSSSLDFLK